LEEVVLVDGLSVPLIDEFWGAVCGEYEQWDALIIGFTHGWV
jgi:hypothetical protein